MKYLTYNPEQAYLLPPSLKEVLGKEHVYFFLHRALDRMDLSGFEAGHMARRWQRRCAVMPGKRH